MTPQNKSIAKHQQSHRLSHVVSCMNFYDVEERDEGEQSHELNCRTMRQFNNHRDRSGG